MSLNNQVRLTGYVSSAEELRVDKNNVEYVRFQLAVSDELILDNPEKVVHIQYPMLIAFGKLAISLTTERKDADGVVLRKGSRLAIEGCLQTWEYKDEITAKKIMYVRVVKFEFLGLSNNAQRRETDLDYSVPEFRNGDRLFEKRKYDEYV